MGRRLLALPLALVLVALLALPSGALLLEEPIVLPPQLVPTEGEGRYLEPTFTFSRTRTDVPYGQAINSSGDLQTLVLDVYEPDGDHTEQFRPVVVWVHGGYFVEGSKNSIGFLHELTRRGYVTVAINYRLRPDMARGLFEVVVSPDVAENAPEFIGAVRDAQHDAMAAIRWVRANAAELRIDPTRVTIAGHSAGGLTTFNTVFNPDDTGTSGNEGWSSAVAAGISSAGAYGPGISGQPALPGLAPMLVLHGTNDDIVPVVASVLPCEDSVAMGNVCEAHLFPGDGHNTMPREETGARSADFLYRHVVQAPRTSTRIAGAVATVRGEAVTVTGTVVTEAGSPVAGARVLGRATDAWASATTAPDGTFVVEVAAPDHGRAIDVLLRYEGEPQLPSRLPLSPPPNAPTAAVVTATWSAG